MAKTYKKPVISVDQGLAEGVYAASGATSQNEIIIAFSKIDADWGGSGQISLSADYTGLTKRSSLSVTLNFNMPVKNVYGDGISGISGANTSTVTLSYWGIPDKGNSNITVQADGNINSLQLDGYTYTSA